MKKIFPFLLVVLVIGVIISCHKNPIPDNGGTDQPSDTIPFATDIIHFGDTTGMIFRVIDSTSFVGNYGMGYFSIDANNDGIEDAQLITEDVGSAGLGHANVITLKCKNRHIAWYGETFQQEAYYHADSTSWYYVDPDYPQFDSIHFIDILQIRTCERIADTDSIIDITEKLSIFDNNYGDELKKSDYFKTADVILKNRSYEIYSEPTGWGTSTLIHYVYLIKDNCDYFPLQEEKYIGFKYTDNDNTERLGWIKIIIQIYYDYRARLLETAIQK